MGTPLAARRHADRRVTADSRIAGHPHASRPLGPPARWGAALGDQFPATRGVTGRGLPSGNERESQTNAPAAHARADSTAPVDELRSADGVSLGDADLVVPSFRLPLNPRGGKASTARHSHSHAWRSGPPTRLEIVETPRCVNVGAYSASKTLCTAAGRPPARNRYNQRINWI